MKQLLQRLRIKLREALRDPVEESFAIRWQDLKCRQLDRRRRTALFERNIKEAERLSAEWEREAAKWEEMATAYEKRFL